MHKSELEKFKNIIGCDWIKTTGKKPTADFIDNTYEGQCKSKPVRFSDFMKDYVTTAKAKGSVTVNVAPDNTPVSYDVTCSIE